ncbi:MAG: hypothetical protein AB1650_08525 [Candidatus Omnitrophota bacterium]
MKKLFSSLPDIISLAAIVLFLCLFVMARCFLFRLSSLTGGVTVSSGFFNNINPYLNIYSLFALALAAGFLLIVLIKTFQNKRFFYDIKIYRRLVLSGIVLGAFMIGLLQVIMQLNYFIYARRTQPYRSLQGIVDNIGYVQRKYPVCKSFAFETDLSLDIDPGMFLHRLWKYFLFPKVIKNVSEADCIIFLQKECYSCDCPASFQIAEKLSAKDAVAVRKDLTQ